MVASTRDASSAAWATVTPAERVFTYTRQAGEARYVFVVNDHRQPGPQQQKWQVTVNAIGRKTLEPLREVALVPDRHLELPQDVPQFHLLPYRGPHCQYPWVAPLRYPHDHVRRHRVPPVPLPAS